MDNAVERAIECIWERYSEPLSLAEIAASAQLSRFYFARLFKDTTGITPGRFLAAIRIHQAKLLLLNTSMSTAEMTSAVGYNSLGSFTDCFTASVGISPGRFRRLSRTGGVGLPSPQPKRPTGSGAIAGTISLPDGHGNARVYMAAFRTPLVQHPPAAGVIVDVPFGRPCCYRLPDVPEGTWFVRAVGAAGAVGLAPTSPPTSLVGRHDAVTVAADRITSAAIRLRRMQLVDPPILLALPALQAPPALAAFSGCPAVMPARRHGAHAAGLDRPRRGHGAFGAEPAA
jgi:AraC-like DNA-binding protein